MKIRFELLPWNRTGRQKPNTVEIYGTYVDKNGNSESVKLIYELEDGETLT